jgi:glycerol-3-phosphate acyltransferase PlsX
MRIAVDAMGGDHAPKPIVRGAVQAAQTLPGVSRLFLVGDATAIRRELAQCVNVPACVEVRHASEVVAMHEFPAQAVRRKKDSSINRAMDLVKNGEADAFLSAGNTGAVVVAATLKLRTLPGVVRPAIATVMPTQDRSFVLIDAGANTDCTPSLLGQFGLMGSIYARVILGRAEPVVGLLSIGGEDTKGNELTKEAFGLLQKLPIKFRGNVEGHDLFVGETDVVVCDGFIGNVVLKTSESVAHAIGHWMKQEFKRNPMRLLGAILLRGALGTMKRKMDPEVYGGAPLLGVNGVCIISHGASSQQAIFNAVRVACEAVEQKLNNLITVEIEKTGMGQ